MPTSENVWSALAIRVRTSSALFSKPVFFRSFYEKMWKVALAVTDEHVYWTAMEKDSDKGHLAQGRRWVSNPPFSEPDFILSDLENLSAIQMVSPNDKVRQLKNSCESKRCSDICMSKFWKTQNSILDVFEFSTKFWTSGRGNGVCVPRGLWARKWTRVNLWSSEMWFGGIQVK